MCGGPTTFALARVDGVRAGVAAHSIVADAFNNQAQASYVAGSPVPNRLRLASNLVCASATIE